MEKIICNPLNLEYRYQIKKSPLNTGVFREAADPTMVVWKGHYLLFVSMSGGFWYSDDLYDWHYKATPELPVYDYAPDVRAVGNGIAFCASKRFEFSSIYFSPDPLTQPFSKVSTPLEFWDPNIFQDDDGRVYLYWGCTPREPIWGIELDPQTMTPMGEKVAMLGGEETKHGWERVGENNKLDEPKNIGERLSRRFLGTRPCIEGAFMTKHAGKYYLQYATPGTEYNVYSDGVYVGESPLGPFAYQKHNPFSSKPGGFITAAGHGSTFQDLQGNWWHISTMHISENDPFERRLGLFPCGFDKDGTLYCNQNFADYPFDLNKPERRNDTAPEWMLLSDGAKATCSSAQKGCGPELAADENIHTCWAACTASEQEWLMLDLGAVKPVRMVQVNFADHRLPMPKLRKQDMVKENIGYRKIVLEKQHTGFILEGSVDGENWTAWKDSRGDDTDLTHDLIVLEQPTACRYVRLRGMQTAMGGVPAVSGLRVFGKGDGLPPAPVERLYKKSPGALNILLRWEAAQGASGYNVRYGIAPNKLYSSWQITDGKTTLDLSTISTETDYYAAVDSYNENGVTPGKVFHIIKQGES